MTRYRRAKWLLWLVALVILSGCSAMWTRYLRLGFPVVYEHADFLIGWEADAYFDLTKEQRVWLDKQVAAQQAWHRKTQLPKYSALLGDVARNARQRPMTPADLARLEDAFQIWFEDSSAQGLDVMGNLLVRVSDEQIQHFRSEIDALNKKAIADSAKRTRADLRDELVDRYQDLVGDLSAAQLQAIDAAVTARLAEDPQRLTYWKHWQSDFYTLLSKRRAMPACFITQFKWMAMNRERWYTPELRRVRDHNEQVQRELALKLLTDLSPVQRAQFARKTSDWVELFNDLAHKPAGGVVAVAQPSAPAEKCSEVAQALIAPDRRGS